METLRLWRRRKGWTQADLAKKAGVHLETVSGIEGGRHEPRPSTLRKIATALGVEVEELFEAPKAGAPTSSASPDEASEEVSDEERREELLMTRKLLLDVHMLLEDFAKTYRAAGDLRRMETLVAIVLFSVMGAEQYVVEKVGEPEDRTRERVYSAGSRLNELVEDMLEALEEMEAEEIPVPIPDINEYREQRKAS